MTMRPTYEEVRESVLAYLDNKDRPVMEVKQFLRRKKYSERDTEEVLQFLVESCIIDDGRYAQNYVYEAFERGKTQKKYA